jgi:hypothetical protein
VTAKVWDAKSGAEVLTLEGHTHFVWSVSFSPDGSRIVTASSDGAKVWDAESGAEVFTLKGHTSEVLSASFSPDGSRIVTASRDGTAKLWDARSGAEVFTLKGHTGSVVSASFSWDGSWITTAIAEFSPDGSRIVTRSADGAKVWDATPINREFLPREFAPPPPAMETRPESALALNNAAWELVKLPNRPEADSLRGLRLAETACQLEPNNGAILNTLGVAQYRTGQYEKAQATLTRSNQLDEYRQPADFAFLAMTQHRLHQEEAARASLERLREVMKDPKITANPENEEFLREAEAVILNSPELPEEVFAP